MFRYREIEALKMSIQSKWTGVIYGHRPVLVQNPNETAKSFLKAAPINGAQAKNLLIQDFNATTDS